MSEHTPEPEPSGAAADEEGLGVAPEFPELDVPATLDAMTVRPRVPSRALAFSCKWGALMSMCMVGWDHGQL